MRENELLRIRLASKKKSRQFRRVKRRRSPSPQSTRDTDVESTASHAPSNKKRVPYLPRSEKTENEWRLPDEQQAYLQKFINSHYTDEELKDIATPKPPPSNITFVKKNDTYVSGKLNLPTNEAQKSKDHSFRSIQERIGRVMGPLGKAWEKFVLINKGEANAKCDIDEVLINIEQAIILLGQSVNYVTHQRRLVALQCFGYKKLEDIRELLRNHITHIENDPEFLFGEGFAKQLADSSKADKETEEALSKNKASQNKKTAAVHRDPKQGTL